jgi:hypothetical protein
MLFIQPPVSPNLGGNWRLGDTPRPPAGRILHLFFGGTFRVGDARKPLAKGQSPSALPLRYLESYITEWLNVKIFKFNLLKSPSLGKF